MRSLMLSAFVAIAALSSARAQDGVATDRRLYPLLGCWRSDTLGTQAAGRGVLTCVVPIAGSPAVDVMSLVDGRVASHRRVEVNSRPRPIEGQGCRGNEYTSWSPLVRRIYLRDEYTCGTGINGLSTTMYSFLPSGEWLEVESVRSGSGALVRTERRRDVGIPNNLPRELAGLIGVQRMAVVTARAEAASPIKPEDVIEATRNADSLVARAWLLETRQHFQLSGEQFMTMARSDVPPSVLQAVMATPSDYQLGRGVDASGHDVDAYLNSPGSPAGVPYPSVYHYGYPYGYAYGYPAPYYEYPVIYECCTHPYYHSYNTYVVNTTTDHYSRGYNSYGYGHGYNSGYDLYPYSLPYSLNTPAYRSFQNFSPRSEMVGVRPTQPIQHAAPARPVGGGRRP